MSEFFAMGGYAAFVWPCYAASILVLGVLIMQSVAAHARARKEIKRLEGESRDAGA